MKITIFLDLIYCIYIYYLLHTQIYQTNILIRINIFFFYYIIIAKHLSLFIMMKFRLNNKCYSFCENYKFLNKLSMYSVHLSTTDVTNDIDYLVLIIY